MKRAVIVLFVLALCVVAFGFYRGWFVVSCPEAGNGDNKVNVNLTVDRDKMHEDAQAVKKRTTDLTGNVTGATTDPDDNPTDNTKSND